MENWIGRDGATVTLTNGVLSATRGLGDDIMGSRTSMPSWTEISTLANYKRAHSYLVQDNKIKVNEYDCEISKIADNQPLEIFEEVFTTTHFVEFCSGEEIEIKNEYYIDTQNIVRKSLQFHSPFIGYLIFERLDPLQKS